VHQTEPFSQRSEDAFPNIGAAYSLNFRRLFFIDLKFSTAGEKAFAPVRLVQCQAHTPQEIFTATLLFN
jgi:hypothetical protein